jgi:nucleoid DNA-binding protein
MKLTNAELIVILSEQVGLTQKASEEVLAVFFNAIITSLGSGKDVRLRKFGKFETVERRKRRTPVSQKNEDQTVSLKKVVRFRPSKFLKACVNDGETECGAWPAELKQMYDNLVSLDRLRARLEDHRKWLVTRGRRGQQNNFARCNLEGIDLEGADLRQVMLPCACLAKADLGYANLDEADLESSNLEGACLAGASLKRANLRGASLRGADMKDADLQGADLSGADLHFADLAGAELENAKFSDSRFFKTNLKNTILDRKSSNSWDSLKTRLRRAMKPKRGAGG